MKKLKNGCHYINIDCMEKFQITNPPLKFGSLVFQVSMEMEYQHQTLWKNWKMAAISLILIIRKNFKLPIHPKFGSPVFWVLTEMEYQCWPLWKNWKMAAILLISIIQKNFKLPIHPKFGSPIFQVLMEMEYQHRPLWKNWKMAAILLILIVWKNFKLPTHPQSLGLQFSKCQQKWNISVGYYKKIENGCHFVNIDRTEKFQITDCPQSLGLVFFCVCWWKRRCKFSFFWIFHWFIFPHHPS